jgi:hypothetical protein
MPFIRASYSAFEPLHQTTLSGCVILVISSTHDRSLEFVVGAFTWSPLLINQ